MDLNEEQGDMERRASALHVVAQQDSQDVERESRERTDMGVIKLTRKRENLMRIANAQHQSREHHQHQQHPRQGHLSTPPIASPLPQACKKQHLKPLSLLTILSMLLLNYLSTSLSVSQGTLVLATSLELAQSNLSFLQSQKQQQQPPPPSQLFLPPVNQQPVSLVNGFNQKRPEEEEDGFIMQASSLIAQNDTAPIGIDELAVPTTETPVNARAAEDEMGPGGEEQGSQQQQQQQDQNDERIPIDANRQQFVTHDQLSLLNASTKDESISLSSAEPSVADEDASASRANEKVPAQKAPTSRSGMSKVSHVSSFLSDLFAYATRPRQPSFEDTSAPGGGSRGQTTHTQLTTTTSTSTTTSRPHLNYQQQATPNTCPGICRSFLTASILCRNEINAPCPSLLQRCCDKDDVSFNGTPVETSAPLNPADTDANSAQLSDNPAQTQESSPLENQTQPAPSTPNSTAAGGQSSASKQAAATTTATVSHTPTDPPAGPPGGSRPGAGPAAGGASPAAASAAPAEAGGATKTQPADGGGDGSVDFLLGATSQPATIYFLSSGSNSNEPPAQPEGPSGGVAKRHQSAEQTDPALVQSVSKEQAGAARPRQSASQSFDSPAVGNSNGEPTTSGSKPTTLQPHVMLQTSNGTIAHQNPADRVIRTRPAYANWTDYHLSILQARPAGQSVVYHSNIDPVKRFAGDQASSTTSIASTTPSPTTVASTTTITIQAPPTTQTTIGTSAGADLSPAVSMGSIKRTLALPSAPGQDSGQDADGHWPADDSQLRVKVINDQHSAGTKLRPDGLHQASAQLPAIPPQATDRFGSVQTTTPKQDGATDSDQLAAGENQPIGLGVGNVIAELIDSWISGSSQSSSSGAGEASGGSPQDQVNNAPEQPVLGDQHNDRRLGYDLSFRQQNQADQPQGRPQTETGLMTSDGTSEQALASASSPMGSLADTGEPHAQMTESKCNGYCTLPLFTMLCDSTYRSADCGPNQKCCVTGRSETAASESGPSVGQPATNQGDSRHQVSGTCQGSCLPVYHSSLCTKPNEVQLDMPGCPPSFICCVQPAVQDGNNHITEEVDSMMGAGSSSVVDQSSGLGVAHHQAAAMGDASHAKDSALLASLLPPLPPPLTQQLGGSGEHQLGQDQNLNDPLIAASSRQRQGPISLLPGSQESVYLPQQQPQSSVAATRAPSTKTSQSGSGIMSHLYQMFKPNSSNKQRHRSPQQQPQQQQQQQQQYQQFQQSQLQFPAQLAYMPQVYEAYQSQIQQQRVPAPAQQLPQQQMMYPAQAHNLMLAQAQFPSTFYSVPGITETGGLIDMQQSKQINNQNRNRVYGGQQQTPARDQQAPTYLASQVSANPLVANRFSPQQQQQQQQHRVPYQHQQQIGQNVDSHQFNENNQLYGEKFAQNSDQTPALASFISAPPTTGQHGLAKPLSNQHQQVTGIVKQQTANIQHPAAIQMPSSNVGPGAFGTSPHPPPNPGERQRYQPASSPAAPAGDNAHMAPFVQPTRQQQQQQQQQSQYQSYHSQRQPVLSPFGTSDSATVQQQQRQLNKVEPQLVALSANRPIGNGNTPVRTQQPPVVSDQRHHAAGSRNGNDQDTGAEQQKSHWRQNAVSRTPAAIAAAVGDGPSGFELNELSGQVVRTIATPQPALRQGGSWLSMGADQQVAAKGGESQQSRRTTAGNRPTKSGAGAPLPVEISHPAQTVNSSSNISPSPSNVNVMITGEPFIDLQRFENNLEQASRRQLLVGGGSPQQQQQYSFAASGGGQVTLEPPPRGDKRTRVPQVQGMTTQQKWLPASSHQQATATGAVNDDLTHSSSTNTQMVPLCPSSCLAPFVSFNCIKPNYIDENFACTSPGSICCVKGSLSSQTATTASAQSSSTSRVQVDAQQPPSITTSQSLDTNTMENNKLDLISDSDDQLDEIGKQQQQQHQGVVEPLPSDEAAEAGIGTLAISSASSSVDERSVAPLNRNRVQACGVPGSRRRANSGRVMGGFEAKPGHWCWQAALVNNKNEYLCGGALIGNKWVLTAAHCITQHLRSESQLYVKLGEHDLNSTQSIASKRIQVKTSYVHHNHNGITLDNDIALLRLEESVDQDDPAICTICLPERSSQMEPGKRCVVTGYGFEDENGPALLRVKQTELPIVADQECQKKTGAVLGKPFTLPASSFCAGGELGQDACHGDGGSPLSCLVDGYYELTGIVSWGYKCGSKDLPGLYSKVSTFVGWINQIVSVNN